MTVIQFLWHALSYLFCESARLLNLIYAFNSVSSLQFVPNSMSVKRLYNPLTPNKKNN